MVAPKRQYSRKFATKGETGSFSVHKIPMKLLTAAKSKAKREGISLRAMLLTRLQKFVDAQ